MERPAIEIEDNAGEHRYEARVGGQLAGFVEYRPAGPRRILLHTEVFPEFEGKGIGSALAKHVLEDARASGGRVTVKCPFLQTYVQRHPEYAALTTQARGAGSA